MKAKINRELSSPNRLESIKQFNEFQSQSRARAEAALKLVMGISGAILTLTVGAVLNGSLANLSPKLALCLQIGIGFLFFSVAASVFLMASFLVATFHMGLRWRRTLDMPTLTSGARDISTWTGLRWFNAILGSVILLSFLVGIFLIARVAISLTGY